MMNSFYRAKQEDQQKWFFDGIKMASMSIKPKLPGNLNFAICLHYFFFLLFRPLKHLLDWPTHMSEMLQTALFYWCKLF